MDSFFSQLYEATIRILWSLFSEAPCSCLFRKPSFFFLFFLFYSPPPSMFFKLVSFLKCLKVLTIPSWLRARPWAALGSTGEHWLVGACPSASAGLRLVSRRPGPWFTSFHSPANTGLGAWSPDWGPTASYQAPAACRDSLACTSIFSGPWARTSLLPGPSCQPQLSSWSFPLPHPSTFQLTVYPSVGFKPLKKKFLFGLQVGLQEVNVYPHSTFNRKFSQDGSAHVFSPPALLV